MPSDSWATITEVADRLCLKEDSVHKMIRNGVLAAINVATEETAKRVTWRISTDSLREFEARRVSTPPVAKPRRSRTSSTSSAKFYA